jgi:lysophospholipase
MGYERRVELFGLDSNPIPEGAVAGAITTADGIRLRTAHWQTTAAKPEGTVCLFQGRSEVIEKYFEVVADLRQRGFAVATLDWRGQGGSERRLRNPRKGHVDSFAEYDRDFDAFMEQVALPDCPLPHYALAHSTGALIALRAAHDGRARFSRMVLTSPLLGLAPARPSPEVAFRIGAFLTAIGLGEVSVVHGRTKPIEEIPFADNPVTSDPLRYRRGIGILKAFPQLAIGPPTFAWLYAAGRAMREAADPDFGSAVKIPVLMAIATQDTIVSPRAIEALALELRAGSQVMIPGARHEILMERDAFREQFWAAFDTFVPERS